MRKFSRATLTLAFICVLALAASTSLASGGMASSLSSVQAAAASSASAALVLADEAALIARVRDAWANAINARDVDALLGLYRPGAVLLPAQKPPQLGAVAIARWHERWAADAEVHYTVHAALVRIDGDQALEEWAADVTVTARGAGMGIGGDPLQFRQHGVRVYRKDGHGNWRIDRETWSPDHPAVARLASRPAGP